MGLGRMTRDGIGDDISPTLVIVDASLLDLEGRWDIVIAGTTITAVLPADSVRSESPGAELIDAAGGLVTRSFVEPHFHPDKAFTRPRVGPVTGADDMAAKMARGAAIKSAFTLDDIRGRARRSLEAAVSHGIGAMRAQVDVDSVSRLDGMAAMLELREEFADLIDLQLVAFPQEGIVRDPGALSLVRAALEMGADVIGGGPNNEVSPRDWSAHIGALLDLAQDTGAPVDLHVDFSEDPGQRALELLAREVLSRGLEGHVNASHCCALAAYPEQHAASVIELTRAAGMQVCICPMSNLNAPTGHLTERGRGASRPKEMLAAGINVAAGSDNLHDMWFRFGRLDPVELTMVTCLAAGMRTDAEIRDAYAMTTSRAASYAGTPAVDVAPGSVADLVLFSASTLDDVLRGVSERRLTIKRGQVAGGIEARGWSRGPAQIAAP